MATRRLTVEASGRGHQAAENDKRSAVDVALHEIRRLILTGELAPGQPFVSQNLAEKLGVSHVPVREALRQLEAQGLVTLNPSRSAVVTALDADDLRSIYRMRLWIEPELAALSAPHRSAVDLARMEDEITATFRQPVSEESWECHNRFHQLFVQPAAGPWDIRILRVLWHASERFTRLAFDIVGAAEDDIDHRRERHMVLLEAARTREPEAARRELRKHLEDNEAASQERLEAVLAKSATG